MPRTNVAVADEHEMLETLFAYAWALDRGDLDGVVATFPPDGAVVRAFDESPGRHEGAEAVRAFYERAMQNPNFVGGQHHIRPLHFEETADGYALMSYFQFMHTTAGEAPKVPSLGYYRDTFVYTDGAWRFQEKVIGPWRSDRPEVHETTKPASGDPGNPVARSSARIPAEDRLAIYNAAAEHTWCIDRGDGEGLASLFTEDGTIVTQGYSRNGRDDILKGYQEGGSSQPGFQGRQHHIAPYLLSDHPEGGYELLSYWYVTQNTVADGAHVRLHGYSRDHFVQQDGRWLMKAKEVIPWTTETAPMVEAFAQLRASA